MLHVTGLINKKTYTLRYWMIHVNGVDSLTKMAL